MKKQEMFDLAVRGLRSQGFNRCLVNGDPVYADGTGRCCAWGWVDPQTAASPEYSKYYVNGLMADGVGVAAGLDLGAISFARQLQWCHDDSPTPSTMERRLKQLGERESLQWPA